MLSGNARHSMLLLTLINSMKNCFEKNRPLLQSLAIFFPSGFPKLVQNFQNAHDLEASIQSSIVPYSILLKKEKKNFHDVSDSDSEEEFYDENYHYNSDHDEDPDEEDACPSMQHRTKMYHPFSRP